MAANMIAVTIAMFCLIAFYLNLKDALAANKPFFKLLCIKLVIFFSFWQMVSFPLIYGKFRCDEIILTNHTDAPRPTYLRQCYKIH